MFEDLHYLLYSTILLFLQLLGASLLKARAWTIAGLVLAFGNRDQLPDPAPVMARADRAAKNMLEAMVLFAPVLLAGHVAGVDPSRVLWGAKVFFFNRVAYAVVYIAGITYVRTLIWAFSLVGIGAIMSTLL
ncbi:MAG: MAPEG family protein [Myxococcota bacterium]